MVETTKDEEILEHYRRFIGPEGRKMLVEDLPDEAPNPLYVVKFPAPSEESDWVYATIGMSRKPMMFPGPGAGIPRYSELLLYSAESYDDLAEFLGNLAAYPFVQDTFFAPGHTVAGSPGVGVVKGSPLTEALLTIPYFEPREFEVILHADGTHTHMLWVTPIYRSERLYVREHGYMALLELFSDHSTEVDDLWRPPVV